MFGNHYIFLGLVVFLCGCTSVLMADHAGGLIINEDDTHFFNIREPEEMTIEGLNTLIDHYSVGQVSHVFLCPNAQRVNYDTQAAGWESAWDGNKPETMLSKKIYNCWLLDQKGIDPYSVWIKRCREKKVSPWVSMRMNDIHQHKCPARWHICFMGSFGKEHPEYLRVPGGHRYEDIALNYGIKEVRDRQMALIKEYLERYDADGIELDWLREPRNFVPGQEAQGRAILTEFMTDVRRLANEWAEKRGHPIGVAVRVPSVPEAAYAWGLDAVGWAKSGLIDVLTVGPRWQSADFHIPIERWRQMLGETADKIMINACMEIRIQPFSASRFVMINNPETMRGFAASMLYRGADEIYLFNHMDKRPIDSPEYEMILKEAGSLETLAGKVRRHVITYHDIDSPSRRLRPALPAKIGKDKPAAFKIHIGPKPDTGNAQVLIGCDKSSDIDIAEIKCQVNNVECDVIPRHAYPGDFGAASVLRYTVDSKHLKDGYNKIQLTLARGGEQKIVWVEMRIIP